MNKLGVVICTSNGYSSFIDIFVHFFNKNFDTSLEVNLYAVGITKDIEVKGVTCLPSILDENAPWSNRVLDGFLKVSEENILFLTEDILFTKSKSRVLFDKVFDTFITKQFDYLRLSPFPSPTKKLTNLYGEVSPYIIHRVSMQPSLWRKEFLMETIKKGESIWEFEVKGSRRTRNSSKVMALNNYEIPYSEVISRGKITRRGFNLLKLEGYHLNNFRVKSTSEELEIIFYHIITFAISKINFLRKYSGI